MTTVVPGAPAPVFLLAPARSGSSLAVTMLGGHPQLYGFPELRLFRAERVADLTTEPPPDRGMPVRDRIAGLLRAIAQLHEGEQTVAGIDRAREWLCRRSGDDVADVLDHLLELVAPRIGIEKSPETTLSDAALARVSARYPAARYLHLVRHPWATVASMVAAWTPLPYWPVPAEHAAQFCADLWVEQHSRIAAFGARLGPARFIRFNVESFTSAVAEVLPAVCRWLRVADGPNAIAAMLAPEDSPFARPGPPNADAGLDPEFLRRPRPRPLRAPASLAAPPSWRLTAETRTAVAELARHLGYDDSAEPGRRWQGRSAQEAESGMRSSYDAAGIQVYEDVLEGRQWRALVTWAERLTYHGVHQDQWRSVWRIGEGEPLLGRTWVVENGPAECPPQLIPLARALVSTLLRGPSLSARISLTPWIYPVGTALGLHRDDGAYAGSFIFYTVPEWDVHWGGILHCVADPTNADTPPRAVLEASAERTSVASVGRGVWVEPAPNRLVVLAPHVRHFVSRVDPNAGDRPRTSIGGFVHRRT